MARLELKVNGQLHTVDVPEQMPLLWVLRDFLGLTGTKYGCGEGSCGVCTVLVDGQALRSCSTPVATAVGRDIETIESDSDLVERLRRAWLDEHVPQCGYCQPGQIMGAAALLRRHTWPDDTDIDDAMRGHLCRCGTYARIRRAIRRAAAVGGAAD